MKVLHCIPGMTNGGAERQLSYLVTEQVRQGLEVHVAFLHDGPYSALLYASGAVVHRLKGQGNHDPRLLWQLFRLVKITGADLVQTWLNQMDILGGLAARMSGVPWILSERSCYLAYPPTIKVWLRARIGAFANAIISNSEGGDDYWKGQVGPLVRRYIIRNTLPLEEIARAKPVELGPALVEPGRKMVVHVGRHCPSKNLINLIPALKLVSGRLPLITFLCGDGTHMENTEELIARHDVANQVVLTGYRSDVWSWMKRADVFISASLFEGHPNAVLEAAACGCPLVLSHIPGHRKMLDERGAFFVDPSSPIDIAEGLFHCLSDPEEARRRAQFAQYQVQGLSIPEMARRYKEVYLELLS
jgi:glycosyltransferase involved in cell wall biosynthesis